MKKEDTISRYGIQTYKKRLAGSRIWREANREIVKTLYTVSNRECYTKGGKYYNSVQAYKATKIPNLKNNIRRKHGRLYLSFKRIIAPESQLHHQWRSGSAEYDGVALVEKEQHQFGFVNVIIILEGKITLMSEHAIRER